MKRKIAYVLMITGLVLILIALAILLYNNYENKRAKESSDAVVEALYNYINENRDKLSFTDPFDTEMLTLEFDGYSYIGYLSIPSLGLDLPVMSDWDYSKLKISPCRYYGSTKTDNLVIAAHNYKYHFGYIGTLREGDIIVFTDVETNVHTYKVRMVDVLEPKDVELVKDTGDDLILYTCNYGGTKRITVRCDCIDE